MDPRQKRRGISLVEMIVVAVVLAVLTVVLLPFYLQQVDKARGAAAKSGVRSIQIAVLAYALDHQDSFPQARTVGAAGLRPYAEIWPANPWTGKPMAEAGHYVKGDFHYEAWSTDQQGGAGAGAPSAPARNRFGLIGYLADPSYPFVVRPLTHTVSATGSATVTP